MRARRRHGARVATALLALALGVAPWRSGASGEIVAPGPREKCLVCGMFVARHPEWTSGIVYRDGSRAVFDGPKDLFKYWLASPRYGGRPRDDVTTVFVTDYYAVRQIEARTAWYVVGSDVLGPMGRDLVPFALEQEARAFLADHRGSRIIRFSDVSDALLRELG